jgi:signal transduction histidine kinase
LLAVYLLLSLQNIELAAFFFAFWIARTPDIYGLRTCILLTLGSFSLYTGVLFWRGGELDDIYVAVLMLATFSFVLSISFSAVKARRQRREAIELNHELKAAQEQLAQTSRLGERLRIARDMHDLLGHHMTALVLNLEVASHKVSDEGLVHVERAKSLARLLLSDLRNAVSDLREYQGRDFEEELKSLVDKVPDMHIDLDMEQDLDIPDAQADTLLRCIQEALTNALRHAHASNCHITLRSDQRQLVLEIRNDGAPAKQITPGNGLKGMQERIQALAGSLRWHSSDGDFLVRAQLPLQESGT